MKCTRCGRELDAGALRCSGCDEWVTAGEPPREVPEAETLVRPTRPTPSPEVETRACKGCGARTEEGWRFCKSCGADLRESGKQRDSVPLTERTLPPGRSGPGFAASEPGSRQWPKVRHLLVQLSAETGREHRIHELDRELTVVGRTQGEVVLPRDSTLSSRHASLEVRAEGCFLKDLGSTNGSFVAVTGTQALAPGAVMLVGAQRLLYRSSGGGKGMELVQVLPRGRDGRSRPLDSEGLTIGKENADFLFPEDEFMSKQHAVVVRTADGHAVRDLGSTNGTYLILRGERELEDGDRLALGDTVFEYRRIVTR